MEDVLLIRARFAQFVRVALVVGSFIGAMPATANAASTLIYRSPVVVNGVTLFPATGVTQAAADERARVLARRIDSAVDAPDAAPENVTATLSGGVAIIRSAGRIVFTVSEQDAASVDLTLPATADFVVGAIGEAIRSDRAAHRPEAIARDIAIAFGISIGAVIAIAADWWVAGYLIALLAKRSGGQATLAVRAQLRLPFRPLIEIAIAALRVARFGGAGFIAYVAVSTCLGLFPQTRDVSQLLTDPFVNVIEAFGTGFIAWLPQAAVIALIVFVIYEALTFLRVIREEMSAGRFTIDGFQTDLIAPTFRLVSFVVLVAGVMAILPHIPGFDSPSFKAVGLLLSALFTFGSASTVANILGGVVLTYVPSFRVGDYIKIGDEEGEVVSKALFMTQIRTFKNVIVNVPNATVMTATILNYSTMATRGSKPLVLHSTVTLGYDIPWRNIHEALIAAALKTEGVLAEPAPFVLQNALNDYNVAYEINAYTREPLAIRRTYSLLHANIQDECNARSIEILSPAYHALRDGNHTTIPENYLPPDYQSPGFRVAGDRNER